MGKKWGGYWQSCDTSYILLPNTTYIFITQASKPSNVKWVVCKSYWAGSCGSTESNIIENQRKARVFINQCWRAKGAETDASEIEEEWCQPNRPLASAVRSLPPRAGGRLISDTHQFETIRMKIGSLDYNSTLRGVEMRCQASSCKIHGCICDCKRIFYNDIGGGFGSSRQFWKPGSSTVIVESPRPPLILKVMTQPWGFYIMLFIAVSLSQMKFGVPGPQAKFPNFWQRLA